MQMPFVNLVGDQDVVAGQRRLPLHLPQQQPLRQEDDLGGGRAGALEADLVAHLGEEGEQNRIKRNKTE